MIQKILCRLCLAIILFSYHIQMCMSMSGYANTLNYTE